MKAQTIFSAFINCVIFENKQALDIYVPSTKDVSKVTFVDFLRPAGNFKPIRSNWSRNVCPPFLTLLWNTEIIQKSFLETYIKEVTKVLVKYRNNSIVIQHT